MSKKKRKKNSKEQALKKQARARAQRIRSLTIWTAVVLLAGIGIYALADSFSGEQAKPVEEDVFAYDRQPVIGNPDAPVKIVEFGDYKCPVCKRFAEEIFPRLKRDFLDTGKAGMYFVDNPFIGEDSVTASIAGEAVYRQNPKAFWTFYEAVYKHQGSEMDTWATPAFLVEVAKKEVPGIDYSRLERDVNNRAYMEAVEADRKIAAELNVDSVPTLFINGRRVDQDILFDYPKLKKRIEEELNASR